MKFIEGDVVDKNVLITESARERVIKIFLEQAKGARIGVQQVINDALDVFAKKATEIDEHIKG